MSGFKKKQKSIAAAIVICMLCSVFFPISGKDGAAFASEANGAKWEKQEDPALIISAADAAKGDGFRGTYKYLTQSQLKGINSEAEADKYFASPQRNSYIDKIVYSAQTKAEKGGWDQYEISGLDMRAVAESMGLDSGRDCTVYTKGKDGHSSRLNSVFTEKLYSFPSETAGTEGGIRVYPAIAVSGNKGKSEFPRFVFGQRESGEFNMQNWEKWLKYVWIGEKQTDLKLTINGKTKGYTLADIIGTKSGSYKAQYRYLDGGNAVTVDAAGIPLDKFLSDAAVTGNYTVKINGKTVSGSPSQYFLAYGAKDSEGAQVSSTGNLVLYGPGERKEDAVTENVTSLEITVKAPGAVQGAKAAADGYSRVKLSWNKTAGAQGYNIYRYESGSKKYELLDCAEGASKVTYIDKNLKTGTSYSYKIKAYITVSGVDLEGGFSKAVKAKPALGKTSVSLSKTGKTTMAVKWSKVSGAGGYQVKLGTNEKMTKDRKVYTLKSGSTAKKTVTKLKRGKRYYVQVRAYRTVSGKKVYGAYSSVKSMKY